MLAFAFTGFSVALSFNFYRKYQARLRISPSTHVYARIADYKGTHLGLAFEYLGEDGRWVPVLADIDEIYHYGRDYFLRGFNASDCQDRVFKWNRIANLRLRKDGRALGSVDALLRETSGLEVRIEVF